MSDSEDSDAGGAVFFEDIAHDETALAAPVRCGYVHKQGVTNKAWKKRWLVLKEKKLFYYLKQDSPEPKGQIPLMDFSVEEAETAVDQPCAFQITTPDRVWYIRADNQENMRAWMNDLYESRDTRPVGYLMKLGGKRKNWKRRFFVLNKQFMIYFKDSFMRKPLGTIPLADSYVEESEGRTNMTCTFEIATPNRTFMLRAESRPEMEWWVEKVKEAVPLLYGHEIRLRSGTLLKKGKHGYWNKRFVAVKNTHLYWYTNLEDPESRGKISLHGADVGVAAEDVGRVCTFFIKDKVNFEYFFACENREEMESWIESVQAAIEATGEYDAGRVPRDAPYQESSGIPHPTSLSARPAPVETAIAAKGRVQGSGPADLFSNASFETGDTGFASMASGASGVSGMSGTSNASVGSEASGFSGATGASGMTGTSNASDRADSFSGVSLAEPSAQEPHPVLKAGVGRQPAPQRSSEGSKGSKKKRGSSRRAPGGAGNRGSTGSKGGGSKGSKSGSNRGSLRKEGSGSKRKEGGGGGSSSGSKRKEGGGGSSGSRRKEGGGSHRSKGGSSRHSHRGGGSSGSKHRSGDRGSKRGSHRGSSRRAPEVPEDDAPSPSFGDRFAALMAKFGAALQSCTGGGKKRRDSDESAV